MICRSLMLSALLTLFLIANGFAEVKCGYMGKKFVCYSYSRSEIIQLIRQKALKLEIDPKLAVELAKRESNLDPLAYSRKGAIGVMQLLPETAKILGVDPYNVEENIEGGLRYLKYLLDKFNGDVKLAIAAYNAGPTAVEKFQGIPPYKETRQFVKDISVAYNSGRIRKIVLPDGTVFITNLPLEGNR